MTNFKIYQSIVTSQPYHMSPTYCNDVTNTFYKKYFYKIKKIVHKHMPHTKTQTI